MRIGTIRAIYSISGGTIINNIRLDDKDGGFLLFLVPAWFLIATMANWVSSYFGISF